MTLAQEYQECKEKQEELSTIKQRMLLFKARKDKAQKDYMFYRRKEGEERDKLLELIP